jgi:hypothetical protein
VHEGVRGERDGRWLREHRAVQHDLGTAHPEGGGLGEPGTSTRQHGADGLDRDVLLERSAVEGQDSRGQGRPEGSGSLELRLGEQGVPAELRLVEPGILAELRVGDAGVPAELRVGEAGVPAELRPSELGVPAELRPVELSIPQRGRAILGSQGDKQLAQQVTIDWRAA